MIIFCNSSIFTDQFGGTTVVESYSSITNGPLERLMSKPDLLLLDEPFSNIDQGLKEELQLKIKKILNEKDVSMGSADQVKEVTGFTIGGVSPVAHLNPLNIYIDQSLSRFKNIYGAAGHPNCIFKIQTLPTAVR
mgnify:CR=1 FL=1